MSNFECEKCKAICYDSPRGYVSGCEHYPADIKYGCHWDLEPDQLPDECVIDNEGPEWCVFAGEVKSKWECEYWRPIGGTIVTTPASPACYGVWYDTKDNPPPIGVWCVGRKGSHRPFIFRAMEEGKILNGTAYIDADNAYRDPDRWQAIAP